MTIFSDQCIPPSLIRALKENGIRVVQAREKGLQRATDEEIFSFARKNSLILLTFDKDFGNILRFDIKKSVGVVIVYIEKMSRGEIFRRTINFFKTIKKSQLRGKLFIIRPSEIKSWPKA